MASRLDTLAATAWRRIVARLLRVLDHKMTVLEARMADAIKAQAPESAADTERDMRTLTTIMQVYSKVAALDDKARAAGAGGDGAITHDDAERLRRELADRLARLRSGGEA